nr:FAD:protein FMN transferase [uncultured Flavobacterium sp.]
MPQTASKTYITKTEFLFHCNVKVKIPEQYGEMLLDECFALLSTIDRKYNSYQPGSIFHQINHTAGNWITIDNDCRYIIKNLLQASDCTKGIYDVTCMPLLRLWGFYHKDNLSVPSKSAINVALEKVDYRKIELKEDKVRISHGQEIITGSFIKSFAVDKLISFLKSKGITDAVVNAGGSTIYGINDETHPTWKINIPNVNDAKETLRQITISNQCFSLSACANNNIVINGKKYGHILNSKTGYPVSTMQVGVWSNEAFLGDVLSTALFAVERNNLTETTKRLQSVYEFEYYRTEYTDN